MKAKYLLFVMSLAVTTTAMASCEKNCVAVQTVSVPSPEDDDDDCMSRFFPDNKDYQSIVIRFMGIMEESDDMSDFKKLAKLNSRCDRLLAHCYDSIHPGEQLTKEQKAGKMMQLIEEAFDKDAGRNTREMEVSLGLQFFMAQYKMVALSNELLQRDASSVKEIKAWHELHDVMEQFCCSATHIQWFMGTGATSASLGVRIEICKSRIADLRRLLATEPLGSDMPKRDAEEGCRKLIADIQSVATEVDTPQKYEAEMGKDATGNYSYYWENMKDAESVVAKRLSKWRQKRAGGFANIGSEKSICSAVELIGKLSAIVRSCLM